jgi:hypothetical protein
MADYEVIDISDSQKWNGYLQRLPSKQQDIYFTPEYYRLYEELGDGKSKCLVFQKGNNVALYPFLINSINSLGYVLDKEYFDIQGAYGYNGVLFSSLDNEFVYSFFNALESFCIQENIIAEFVRIGQFFDSKFHLRNNFSILFNQKNIVINLLNDNLWKESYDYSTRKNINKAIRYDLEFYKTSGEEISLEYLEVFINLYKKTMLRNNADKYYYFNNEYFKNIASYLGNRALFYFVSYKKKLISCELVLTNGYNSYSFLGGTDSEYFYVRPNDFLKHCIINDLKTNKGINFCLGGGTEGIFHFKESFCKSGVAAFYIGKKIHNPSVYDEVVAQWETKYPEKIDRYKNLVLKYRY